VNSIAVGIEVSKLRKRAELTQTELARRAGTTQAVVSRLESGAKIPGFQLLDRIVSATGGQVELTLGRETTRLDRDERRRRVRQVLGDYQFNPWDRQPSEAEARSLTADGLDRERFSRT
jgi:transcriptional regulator with XRE-family HTH domain